MVFLALKLPWASSQVSHMQFCDFRDFLYEINQEQENLKIRAEEDKKVFLKNNYLQIKTLRHLFPYV